MGTLERQMSEGSAWNQGELTEETRRMVMEQAMNTNHTMAIFGLMDDILAVSQNPRINHSSSSHNEKPTFIE